MGDNFFFDLGDRLICCRSNAVGRLATTGPGIEGRTVGVFHANRHTLDRHIKHLADDLLYHGVNTGTDIRHAQIHVDMTICFNGDRRTGFSGARWPLINGHAAPDIFRSRLAPARRFDRLFERVFNDDAL